MEDKIFELLNPTDNDKLLDLKGYDLQDFLYYLNNFYLTLRDSLGLDENVTFGMELEFERSNKALITRDLVHQNLDEEFKVKHDGSLGMGGGEIATPVLRDLEVDWEKLEKVCKICSSHATIMGKAGGHIHIGAQILGFNTTTFLNFLKLWAVYENIIFRFSYGEFLTGRDGIKTYAYSVREKFEDIVNRYKNSDDVSIYGLLQNVVTNKYQAANFQHITSFNRKQERNTIEFRCPNGTLNPVIWQNNLNFFVRLIEYARSNEYNDDIVSERRNFNEDLIDNTVEYNKIYLRQALELSDMIFNNNLDKVYFLRQYLKQFESTNQPLAKAKPFTKAFK